MSLHYIYNCSSYLHCLKLKRKVFDAECSAVVMKNVILISANHQLAGSFDKIICTNYEASWSNLFSVVSGWHQCLHQREKTIRYMLWRGAM